MKPSGRIAHFEPPVLVRLFAIIFCMAAKTVLADVVVLNTKDTLAAPEQPDKYNIYLGDQITYDDNIFRLPSGFTNVTQLVGPQASYQDHINTITAGMKGQWTYGVQGVGIDVVVNENRYIHNSNLDNTSGHAKLTWDWQAGPRWLNEFGASYGRGLANFANNKFFERDMIDQSQYFANARFLLGSHFNILGGARYTEVSHTAAALNHERYQGKSESLGIEYSSPAENLISLNYLHRTGTSANQQTFGGLPFNPDFNESSESVAVKYFAGSSLTFNASGGFIDRKYPYASIGAFSGPTWSASLQWQPSAKTQVAISGLRELSANIEAESYYFVSTVGNVVFLYFPTPSITLTLGASKSNFNYINSGFDVIGQATPILALNRQDKVEDVQAQLNYAPRRWLTVRLSYILEHRMSNIYQDTYDDKFATAWVSFTY